MAPRERPLDGPLRIGIPDEYSTTILPRVLADFSVRHPDLEVTVRRDYTVPQLEQLDADGLDIAVIFAQDEPSDGEVLCVDPTVWVTTEPHRLHRVRPTPVASYFRSVRCRDVALGSLVRHGIRHRIAFECDTSSGLREAARAGLAVSPLARSSIPEGCRELTAKDGFPVVDASRVGLRRNSAAGSNQAVEALVSMLRAAFRPRGRHLKRVALCLRHRASHNALKSIISGSVR